MESSYIQTLRRNKQRKSLWNRWFQRLLVRVTGVEPAWPWSQTKCLTDRLHPDIQFWTIIPRPGRKSKFFLSVVIYVVKAGFWPGFAANENPANACAARGSGLCLFASWIDRETLPKQARYQLRYTRLFSFLSGWAYSPKHIHTPVHASEENMG